MSSRLYLPRQSNRKFWMDQKVKNKFVLVQQNELIYIGCDFYLSKWLLYLDNKKNCNYCISWKCYNKHQWRSFYITNDRDKLIVLSFIVNKTNTSVRNKTFGVHWTFCSINPTKHPGKQENLTKKICGLLEDYVGFTLIW